MKTKIGIILLAAIATAFFASHDRQSTMHTQTAAVNVVRVLPHYVQIQESVGNTRTIPLHAWCQPKKNVEGSYVHIKKIIKTLPNGSTVTSFDTESVRKELCY